jgi:hypothetical protein
LLFLLVMKKYLIFNYLLSLTILFSILFQSFHSYEHIIKEFSQKHCEHKYSLSKTEISHDHKKVDYCFLCDFSFGNSMVSNPIQYNTIELVFQNKSSVLFSNGISSFFKGSLFSLRAPPFLLL